jgi:hypothetical protein
MHIYVWFLYKGVKVIQDKGGIKCIGVTNRYKEKKEKKSNILT